MTAKHPARIPALLAAACALACATHGVHVERLPDGSFEYKCNDEPLWVCLSHVDDVCKGGTYVVLGGRDEPRIYGNAENRIEGHQSKAIVRCLRPGEQPKEIAAEPVHAPVVAHTVPGKPAAPPAPPRACVPGTTQACIGTAACSGGQACLADGSGFGPCDCGSPP
jgi:hypothetical protein